MEPPLVPAHRGCVPWQRHLLAVSLITFWILPSTAQLTVESVPAHVAEGEDVLLLIHNLPENHIGFSWYKGENVEPDHQIVGYEKATQTMTNGTTYSGRETLYTNGSLLFRSVSTGDTMNYTLQVIKNGLQTEKVTGQLRVHRPVAQPSIQADKTTVAEGDLTILTCLTNNTRVSVQWFFNGHSLRLTVRMQLSQDNSTLVLNPIQKEDTGYYYCEVSNPISSSKSDFITLSVISGGSNAGLSVATITGFLIGVLFGIALSAALGYFLFLRRTGRSCGPGRPDLRQHWSPVSSPECGPSTADISLSPQTGPGPAAPIYEECKDSDRSTYIQMNPSFLVSS